MKLYSNGSGRNSSIVYLISIFAFILLLTSENIQESSAIYPYTIKGYVQDIRHQPGLIIGGWALKKALKLKKLKILIALKIKLKLKLLAKKLLFKFLLGRKKRALTEDHEIDLPDNMIPEIHENDIIPYYIMASEFDQQGCLPKTICDVMARNKTRRYFDGFDNVDNSNNEMSPFERMITEDYKDVPRPEDTTSPSFVYEYAAYYGRNSQSERACASLFSTCKESVTKLYKIMDGSYRTDICDSPDEVEYFSSQSSQQSQLNQQYLQHDVQSTFRHHQHSNDPPQQSYSHSKLRFE